MFPPPSLKNCKATLESAANKSTQYLWDNRIHTLPKRSQIGDNDIMIKGRKITAVVTEYAK